MEINAGDRGAAKGEVPRLITFGRMETLAFDQIHMHGSTVKSAGKFKAASGGIGWKEAATGLVTTIAKEDFDRIEWYKAMRGYQMRLYLKNGTVNRFDGFAGESLRDLGEFSETNWGLRINSKEVSVKGHNWGKAEVVDGDRLQFSVGEKIAFDLALKDASNVVLSAKDEVAIEFTGGEGSRRMDSLCEIRFYIPSAPKKGDDDDEEEEGDVAEDEKVDADGDAVMADEEEQEDRAATLFEAIKAGTNLDQITGEIFAELPELPCIVPRGRYGLEMAATYLRLHGKSYDYKILYTNIVKLFMVPRADDTHVLLLLQLDPPIRQGQTRYPFVVFQFDKDEIIEVDLKNIDEAAIKEKYDGKLAMRYEAPTFEVVSTLFRVLAGQKILVPGSYKGFGGSVSIKCALKASEGHLYPLERNFLFLPKPTTLIPHADIANVEFSRVGSGMGNPRSFDIKFSLRSGLSYAFSNAPKEDYHALEDFCRQKEIPFTRHDDTGLSTTAAASRRRDDTDDLGLARKRTALDLDDDESDDEEYQEGDSDDSSVADGSDDDEDEDDDDEDEDEEEEEDDE